jgi:hypothetical protein
MNGEYNNAGRLGAPAPRSVHFYHRRQSGKKHVLACFSSIHSFECALKV